jgi:hypothetical protein
MTFSRSSCSFVAGSFTLSARAKESRRLAIDIDILSIAVSLSRISTQFNSCFLASPPTPDSMAHDMCHGMCFMGLHNGSVYINFCALFDNVICLGSACARERIDSRLCSIITCYVMFDYLWEAKETVVGGWRESSSSGIVRFPQVRGNICFGKLKMFYARHVWGSSTCCVSG